MGSGKLKYFGDKTHCIQWR